MRMSCDELKKKYKEQKAAIKKYLAFAFYKKYFSRFGFAYVGSDFSIDFKEYEISVALHLDCEIVVKCVFQYYIKEDGGIEAFGTYLYIGHNNTTMYYYDWNYDEFDNHTNEECKPMVRYFIQNIKTEFPKMAEYLYKFYRTLFYTSYLHNLQCTYTFLLICQNKQIFPKDIYLLIAKKILGVKL